jgi:hypothetical protein
MERPSPRPDGERAKIPIHHCGHVTEQPCGVAEGSMSMTLAAEWHVGQVFWSMLWFFLFFIWIWLLITVFADVFRSHDIGGFAKALWVIFVIVVPFLGVLVYFIARGHKMSEHAIEAAQAQDAAMRAYVQDAAGSTGTASEIQKLADLRQQGVLSEQEFTAQKAKLLSN